jgi:hypothetical protein
MRDRKHGLISNPLQDRSFKRIFVFECGTKLRSIPRWLIDEGLVQGRFAADHSTGESVLRRKLC